MCWDTKFIWLVVSTPLKSISQLGWLFPIYGTKCSKPPISHASCQLFHSVSFIPSFFSAENRSLLFIGPMEPFAGSDEEGSSLSFSTKSMAVYHPTPRWILVFEGSQTSINWCLIWFDMVWYGLKNPYFDMRVSPVVWWMTWMFLQCHWATTRPTKSCQS